MALRTHQLLRAIADENRVRVLLAVLDSPGLRPGDLEAPLGLKQPVVSRAVRELLREGLLARGSERQPLTVPRPREVRALIRAAALIEYETSGNPDALSLADRLRKQDMARGASEPPPADSAQMP